MTKTIIILLALSVFCSANDEKEMTEPNSKETRFSAENIKIDDENESASIQIVPKKLLKDMVDHTLHDNRSQEAKNFSRVLEAVNSTPDNTSDSNFVGDSSDSVFDNPEEKLDTGDSNFVDDFIGDSSDSVLDNPEEKLEDDNSDYNNRAKEITIVIEDITKAYNYDKHKEENSSETNEDNNNWRSAENIHSGINEYSTEAGNEEISFEEDNDEDYMDKKISVNDKDRMDLGKTERREHSMRLIPKHYGPTDEHIILDSVPIRRFGEIVVPRLRPTLTRNGIIFTPTLVTMETASPILDQLPVRDWRQNRPHVNPEKNIFTGLRNNRFGVAQYEIDSKQIDDYNDYGSNGYSYTPNMKTTTQAAPQQSIAPNKFDIFQKLAEASNQPKLPRKTYNDNLYPGGNYYSQRQYSESYGPFDVRRLRRNARDDRLFQDI